MVLSDILTTIQSYFVKDSQRDPQLKKVEQYTKDVLSYLEDGEWASLHQQLVYPLRLFISQNVLKDGWKTLTGMAGPLRPMGTPTIHVGWPFTRVSVALQSGRISLALTFWLTWSGKLLTIQIGPQLSQPWKAASYACTDARLVSLTLGRGLSRVSATLTMPPNQKVAGRAFPCVILIGGSGPVDKDSTIGTSKPFKDLALGLAGQDICVCRFDKRSSTLLGKLTISKKTVTLTDEYIYHVLDAIKQVRSIPGIDPDRIILLGHSLGSLIAARLASIDTSLAGCILMAAPSESVYRCAIRQLQYLESTDSSGNRETNKPMPEETSDESDTLKKLRKQSELADSPDLDLSTPANKLPFGVGPAYWLEHRTFDTMETLKYVRKPVLILQGERDYQVTAEGDYARLYEKFGSLSNFTFRLFENLNHLFIAGHGAPNPLEYFSPGNMDTEVITEIGRWVKEQP